MGGCTVDSDYGVFTVPIVPSAQRSILTLLGAVLTVPGSQRKKLRTAGSEDISWLTADQLYSARNLVFQAAREPELPHPLLPEDRTVPEPRNFAYTPSAHTAPRAILPGPDTQKLKIIEITWLGLDDMPKDQQVICSLILTAPNVTSFHCVIFGHNSHNNLKWERISHRRTESGEKAGRNREVVGRTHHRKGHCDIQSSHTGQRA